MSVEKISHTAAHEMRDEREISLDKEIRGESRVEKDSMSEYIRQDFADIGSAAEKLEDGLNGRPLESVWSSIKSNLNERAQHFQEEMDALKANPKAALFLAAAHVEQHVMPMAEYMTRTGLVGPFLEMITKGNIGTIAMDMTDDAAAFAMPLIKSVPIKRIAEMATTIFGSAKA